MTNAPPQDLNAEVAVLSAMMLNSEGLVKGLELLKEEDFYKTAHRVIFKAMFDLFAQGTEVDIITVLSKLEQMNKIALAGGKSYINDLSDVVLSHTNLAHHAKIVLSKSTLRGLITHGQQLISQAYAGEMESSDICDWAETSLFRITQKSIKKTFAHVSQIIPPVVSEIKEIASSKITIVGIPSDYSDLDSKIGGFRPGQLIMIAARPSLGKSSLAVNIAFKTAFVHDKIVGVFTLEMGNYELIYRMLSFAAHVNLGNMMTGKISDHDIETIEDRAKNIMNKNIFIDDSGYNSISEIKAKARRLKAEQKKLDLIIIDYIQLMSAGKSHDNRNSELSEISRGLKILAKDLEIPVIALSQLSRDSDKGGNPRKPRLSDLRDSGALEQDADIVMFLHKSTKDDQLTDLIIAKNRNGPTGEVKLLFIPEYTLFKNAPEADVNAPYINQKNHYWHN